jgi:DMSO/TMAO reductase YedYZ molybdopterin-dependent catalytic subunit
MADSLGILGYDSFHFIVGDLARSRRFYTEGLGFTEVARASGAKVGKGGEEAAVFGEVERPFEVSWTEFGALPQRDVLCDIHCVTTWSRYDNTFSGVPVTLLLERAGVRRTATHVLVHAEENYTTNLPLPDLARDANLIATHHDSEPLLPEHGGPARLVVPHLYFWKSAKWVRGLELMDGDWPGFWEQNGYHMRGDPWQDERYGRPDPARMRRGPRK